MIQWITSLLNINWRQRERMKTQASFWIYVVGNMIAIFSVVYLFIILKGVLRYLMGYTFF